ncbi:MAG: hypothetical protein V1779_03225 [bacterium]
MKINNEQLTMKSSRREIITNDQLLMRKKWITDNRQPTTDNRQRITDNRQQTTDNGKLFGTFRKLC